MDVSAVPSSLPRSPLPNSLQMKSIRHVVMVRLARKPQQDEGEDEDEEEVVVMGNNWEMSLHCSPVHFM